MRALLAGEATDAAAFGARLRYPLERTHLAVVLWAEATAPGDREPGHGTLERTAAELGRALAARSTLVVGLEDEVVAVWMAGVRPAAAGRISDIALAHRNGPVWGASGLADSGIDGFRKSHEQAMQARRVARLGGADPGRIVSYADVALTAIATADLEQARDFARRELAGLIADTAEARRLAATVRIYLEEGSSARRAASRLHVHENTIKNRIRTAEELLGHPVTTRVAEMLLALRIAMLEPGPQEPFSRGSSAS